MSDVARMVCDVARGRSAGQKDLQAPPRQGRKRGLRTFLKAAQTFINRIHPSAQRQRIFDRHANSSYHLAASISTFATTYASPLAKMQMPDVPVNVPVDDPNADTEWLVNTCIAHSQTWLIKVCTGTTYFGNMASSQKSPRRRRP